MNLQNNTGSDTVYAYVTGQALDNGNALMLLESDGQTPYYPASPAAAGSPLAADCAIPLGASGGVPTPVTIPHLAGARIWFSIGSPLKFLLNPGPALVEPSVTNPSDPNIDLQWDFCELTYNDAQVFANISFVDFVCIPVALTLTGSAGTQAVPGLPGGGLDTVCAGLAAQAAADGNGWNDLIISRNENHLRALSPVNAMVLNSGLLAGYYDSYVSQVWQKYATTPLTVDTQPSFGTVAGEVSGGLLTFGGVGSFAAFGRGHLQLQQRAVQPGRDECRNARDPAPPGRRLQPEHAAYRRQSAGRRRPGRLLHQRDYQSLRADRSRDHGRRPRVRIPVRRCGPGRRSRSVRLGVRSSAFAAHRDAGPSALTQRTDISPLTSLSLARGHIRVAAGQGRHGFRCGEFWFSLGFLPLTGDIGILLAGLA